MINSLLARVIQSYGYETRSAFNGQQALEWLLREPFSCVIMVRRRRNIMSACLPMQDVMMPTVDGLTATREARLRGCQTPIIACTAALDAQACAAAGCNDWLPKPFTRDTVQSVIQKWAC